MRELAIVNLLSLLFCISLNAQQASPAMSLDRLLELYVQNSVEVQAARVQIERSQAEQIAATLRPNPTINFTADNFPVSGPTPFGRLYEVGATYTETIELGGKRQLRQTAADRGVSAAEARFEDSLRKELVQVKRLYYAALLAQYNLAIVNENSETLDQLVAFNLVRFQEGAIPELDLIKVRLERTKFDSAVRQAELAIRQATIQLMEKVGFTSFGQQTVEGNLDLQPVVLDINSLRQSALADRPDLRTAEREVEAASARLNLERGRAAPDLLPFAGYRRVGSDNTLLAGITIPLKFRDRNQAGIARADAEFKAAQLQVQLLRNRILAEVQAAFEALLSAQESAEAFQAGLLKQSDEARAITVAAYEEGGTDLLPVLEAQRTRTEVRQQHLQTLFEYHSSLLDLELAVGKELQP